MNDHPLRQLPSVARLLEHARLKPLRDTVSHEVRVEAIRSELEAVRSKGGMAIDEDALAEAIVQKIRTITAPRYRTVINATGIVLHTNLGRSPMADSAAKAAYDAARNYVALELDLATGKRSSRQNPLREPLCRLTGAESATVVNNCAAATVIALRAIAAGKEVIVSRGQLVEIGGGFRIPEILATSGAILREVGTTNITRLRDYHAAITPDTAAILRVHTSNYRIRGFTESVGIRELATLGVPVIDDVGSGAAIELFDEPTIHEGIAAGADLVLFSGDKLLGGPQAGIIAGKAKWIEAIERDPLMRAFRADKMTLAALAATLELYRGDPQKSVPTLAMLAMTHDELRLRAIAFAEQLKTVPGLTTGILDDVCYAGGGSLADQAIPTVVIALEKSGISEEDFAAKLRSHAVLARRQNGKVLIDLRTVFPEQEPALLSILQRAI